MNSQQSWKSIFNQNINNLSQNTKKCWQLGVQKIQNSGYALKDYQNSKQMLKPLIDTKITSKVSERTRSLLAYAKSSIQLKSEAVKNSIIDSKDSVVRLNQKLKNNWSEFSLKEVTLQKFNKIKNHQKSKQALYLLQKYSPIINQTPVVRDALVTYAINKLGLIATGNASSSSKALVLSKIYGGLATKSSLFSYLQSIGTSGLIDPTLAAFLIMGGTCCYYYFYIYNPKYDYNPFKFDFNQTLKCNSIKIPINAKYKNGKFDIKWKKLTSDHQINRIFQL